MKADKSVKAHVKGISLSYQLLGSLSEALTAEPALSIIEI